MVDDPTLLDMNQSIATAHGVDQTVVDAAVAAGADPALLLRDDVAREPVGGSVHTDAVVRLAHAISPSPAVTTDELAAATAESLRSAEIIEIAVWISVLQLIRRISLFHS